MINDDLLFILLSGGFILLSYYFIVLRKKKERQQEFFEPESKNGLIRNENQDQKLTKAEMIKEARKKKKQEKQEANRLALERRRKLEEAKEKQIEERDRKEREKEMKEEEQQKKEQEEREKKEQEEYEKWKDLIVLEETGNQQDEQLDQENLLQNFIDYIKLRKVVEIEDLSVNFKLARKAVLERINDLENSKLLQGVLDERGKYIYIQNEEIDGIQKIIHKKGRLTRKDLVNEFSKIIRLEPREEDRPKIKEYEQKYSTQIDKELKQIQAESEKK